jgi:hypothetical protein
MVADGGVPQAQAECLAAAELQATGSGITGVQYEGVPDPAGGRPVAERDRQ